MRIALAPIDIGVNPGDKEKEKSWQPKNKIEKKDVICRETFLRSTSWRIFLPLLKEGERLNLRFNQGEYT